MTTPFDELPIIEKSSRSKVKTTQNAAYSLVVWNDNVNTFDWVIKTLMEVCGHTAEQAEQCSLLIHHKGKYEVKCGEFDILKNQCDAIRDRKIDATVESRG